MPTDPSPTDHGQSAMQVVRDRSVAVYLVAASLSAIGMFLQAAALGKQVYDITDSEFALGMLGLVEFLPALLLLPLTGSAADRFDRRRIGAIGFGAEVITSVLFCWYAATNPTSALPIFMVAALFGTARAFVSPAVRSIPPLVAPDGHAAAGDGDLRRHVAGRADHRSGEQRPALRRRPGCALRRRPPGASSSPGSRSRR